MSLRSEAQFWLACLVTGFVRYVGFRWVVIALVLLGAYHVLNTVLHLLVRISV